MSAFELIELRFDPEDAKPTIEDEFTMTMVAKDIEKLDDPEELKIYGIIRAINSKRQKLTSVRNKLLRDDSLEESDKEMRLERLDKAIQKLINRGNQLMKNVKLGYLSELGVTD